MNKNSIEINDMLTLSNLASNATLGITADSINTSLMSMKIKLHEMNGIEIQDGYLSLRELYDISIRIGRLLTELLDIDNGLMSLIACPGIVPFISLSARHDKWFETEKMDRVLKCCDEQSQDLLFDHLHISSSQFHRLSKKQMRRVLESDLGM